MEFPRKRLGATASTALLAVAPLPWLNCILQIARVGSVHTKGCPLDVFHRPDVYFVGEHVALRHESAEVVQKFGLFHFSDVLDEKLAISRRPESPSVFNREISLPVRLISRCMLNRVNLEQLLRHTLTRVRLEPIPNVLEPPADFALNFLQLVSREFFTGRPMLSENVIFDFRLGP